MDSIPSKSISKSLLIATPLFLIILAVLNTSNQISYLFVLDFVNNIGGKADIMFLPTLQPEFHTNDLYKDMLMMNMKIQPQSTIDSLGATNTNQFLNQVLNSNISSSSFNIPLVNMSHIEQWQNRHQLVKGSSPRWLFPIVSDNNIDSLIMVMNISHEGEIGFTSQSNLSPLNQNQIAIPQQLFNRLGNFKVGEYLQINFAIKNLFNGMKLIQKFQDPTSNDEFTTLQPQLNITLIAKRLYEQIKQNNIPIKDQWTEEQFQDLILELYDAEIVKKYKVKYIYKESGLYPSALHNVILMEYNSFGKILAQFFKQGIIENKKLNISQYIPKQYQPFWNLAIKSETYDEQAAKYLSELLQRYCVIAVSLLKNRQLLYHPDAPLKAQYSTLLQKSPENVQVISLYPFYEQSLSIKYFFGSVIQIFEVVTCVIYFYTMSLIMKQIYQEKQIQVGIWRTLGAGGVKQQLKMQNSGVSEYNKYQLNQEQTQEQRNPLSIRYKLNQKLTLKQKIFYYYKILVKIGFMYYWLTSSLISILIYISLKYIFIGFICSMLNFNHLSQSIISPLVLFLGVFLLSQILSVNHIRNIYISPLSLTIKPVKRTFDQVKIRIIHLATFGISSEMLLIAIMLIYYGVVSYYWIPFSILDNDGDLQVLLFNSIFIFMIFGSIILISVVQSSFERLILRGLFLLNQRLRKMKAIMLKNIKAKQYKNIKMSIIIAVTFAFLLFFSTGINIEIMIVESFIQRDLGASLILQNYEKKSFNQSAVQNYLNTLPNVKYSWISSDINSDDIKIDLINQMDPKRKISCQFKVMTPNYLDSSFYQYYYPQDYIKQNISLYRTLPNGIVNGFDALYKYDNKLNNQSIGKFNSEDTMVDFDPNLINVGSRNAFIQDYNQMAPQQQIINFAASSLLKIQMGAKVGDLYKMRIKSNRNLFSLNIRSRIVHSYKIGPGMDLLRPQAFITQQQAKYIQRILGHNETIRYQKLLIEGPQVELKQIGNKILAMSPQHTEMFEMKIVSQSFALLEKYLSFYIILISAIMGTLAVLFVFLYAIGKCRDEADMYKMLRAIGLPVNDIRIMIFLQILIRLLVSIVNGIVLGIVFSLGFGMQIEQFLMINTPGMDLSLITTIAVIMFTVFCATVYMATKYLTKRTVLNTSKD